jgi:Transposase Tn5 dimerisation domain/Transposase DNA-binding
MIQHPEDSLPQQMQSPSELEAAYRLLNNPYVSLEKLLEPHSQQTLESARAQQAVVWVEDTTELDYTFHAGKSGLGPIGDGKGRGLLMHSTIGMLPGSATVLGLGHVQVVLREEKPKVTRHWAGSPESRLWERSAEAVGPPPEGRLWVHVSDRGSDIFEYMAACRKAGKHFLLRVFHNRVLSWGEELPEAQQTEARKLLNYARSLPQVPESDYSVAVHATSKHPARQAQVVLAWASVTLPPPEQAPEAIRQEKPIAAWVLRAWEPNPPPDTEAVEWVLLTSLPIHTLEEAQRCVHWYELRWFCEDFHQCLKTGCRIERSQLDDAQDLQNLLGFAAPIAVRLLQLRQEARHAPDAPATTAIEPLMVEVLARRQKVDAKTLTTLQFWLLVARLGGFQGRKRDGNPGWRTVWHGWCYLSDLTEGARLFLTFDSS